MAPNDLRNGTAALARRLRAWFVAPPKLTLSVAESLTCGRLQAAIGSASGASEYFLGGMTAYTIGEKVRHLGVNRDEAVRCEAVSAAIVAQMAAGSCRLFGSDLAVATTGFAEPKPGRGFAVPAAFFAIAQRRGERCEIVREGFFEGSGLSRIEMQEAVTARALGALEDVVRGLRPPRNGRPEVSGGA